MKLVISRDLQSTHIGHKKKFYGQILRDLQRACQMFVFKQLSLMNWKWFLIKINQFTAARYDRFQSAGSPFGACQCYLQSIQHISVFVRLSRGTYTLRIRRRCFPLSVRRRHSSQQRQHLLFSRTSGSSEPQWSRYPNVNDDGGIVDFLHYERVSRAEEHEQLIWMATSDEYEYVFETTSNRVINIFDRFRCYRSISSY